MLFRDGRFAAMAQAASINLHDVLTDRTDRRLVTPDRHLDSPL